MWVDFYEVNGKIVPGFKVILHQVIYDMPAQQLLKQILDKHQQQVLEMLWHRNFKY